MAYVKQIAIGTDVYDIKAKAYDGLVPVANGGTGANNAADAKVNLNLCASGQDFRLGNYNGTSQIWGFRADCVNTNNIDYNGKDIGLVVDDTGLLLWNHSADSNQKIWRIDPDSYLKLSGGTMTSSGQILKEGQSKSWYNGRDAAIIRQTTYGGYCPAVSMKTTNGSWEIGVHSSNNLHFCYVPDASYTGNTNSNTVSSAKIGPDGKVYGAVWNDFAEYRVGENNPGKVMVENGDDTISISTKRLQPGSMICSDTFGFSIGETEECKCPIAIAGRVLAYTYEPRDEYKNNIGQAVCSGPDGTVSLMTKDEVKEYPECVIGYISAVPDYEEWGTGKVKVDGRVWIKVK